MLAQLARLRFGPWFSAPVSGLVRTTHPRFVTPSLPPALFPLPACTTQP